MRICIDARGNRTGGVYTYTYNLLTTLRQVDPDFEYLVLLDEQLREQRPELQVPGLEYRITPTLSPAQTLIWNNRALPRLLDEERIDLHHGLKHFGLRRPRQRPCQMMWTLHATTWWVHPELHKLGERVFWPRYYALGGRLLDTVVCVSESERRIFANATGVPQEKIAVTYHSTDRRFEKPGNGDGDLLRQRYDLPEKFVLFVGAIYPFKNVEMVLDAFAEAMSRNGLPHHLVIVGEPGAAYGADYLADRKAQARDLGIDQRVHWLGEVVDDLPGLYALAEVFFFPSLLEAFGKPALEAMACGAPVITSRVGGIPEVVGDAALLCEPSDKEGFVDALARVLLDPRLAEELSAKSLARAALFPETRCAEDTVALYRKRLSMAGED